MNCWCHNCLNEIGDFWPLRDVGCTVVDSLLSAPSNTPTPGPTAAAVVIQTAAAASAAVAGAGAGILLAFLVHRHTFALVLHSVCLGLFVCISLCGMLSNCVSFSRLVFIICTGTAAGANVFAGGPEPAQAAADAAGMVATLQGAFSVSSPSLLNNEDASQSAC